MSRIGVNLPSSPVEETGSQDGEDRIMSTIMVQPQPSLEGLKIFESASAEKVEMAKVTNEKSEEGIMIQAKPIESIEAQPIGTIAEIAFYTPAGKWSSGLFDCCQDLPICCYVSCCYYCAFGHVMKAHFPNTNCCQECMSLICWDFLNGCFGAFYHSQNRTKMRQKYGEIQEEPYSDCVTSCFCGCCALCQEARHAKAAKPNSIGCLGM